MVHLTNPHSHLPTSPLVLHLHYGGWSGIAREVSEEVHGIEVGQVVPLYLPVDDEPQFPRIPLVDDGPAHPTLAHLKDLVTRVLAVTAYRQPALQSSPSLVYLGSPHLGPSPAKSS